MLLRLGGERGIDMLAINIPVVKLIAPAAAVPFSPLPPPELTFLLIRARRHLNVSML